MKIAVSGASGLVGTELTRRLVARGDDVVALVRRRSDDGIYWNPDEGSIDATALAGVDAVVHLAGENVAAGRWTAARKQAIRSSRVDGTRLVADALAGLGPSPATLVCASAIGIYGDRRDAELTERSSAGAGFLPEVCSAWESACEGAVRAGIRVVNLRIGVVLTPRGGALSRMLPPFKMGVGGVIGSGRQLMSWITLSDLCRVVEHCLDRTDLSGAVNAVAPGAVTNRDFTRALGRVLSRPTLFPIPAPIVKLLFSEMGEALLLASARVKPERLLESGFQFEDDNVEAALRRVLSP